MTHLIKGQTKQSNPEKCWSYNFVFSGMALRLRQIDPSTIQLNRSWSALNRKTSLINHCDNMRNIQNYSYFNSLLNRKCQNLLCYEGILLSWNFIAEFWWIFWWNNVVCQSNSMSFSWKVTYILWLLNCYVYFILKWYVYCSEEALQGIDRKCANNSAVGCL